MKISIAAAVGAFLSVSNALSLVEPRGTPKVLSFDLERRLIPAEHLEKRASSIEVPIQDLLGGIFYNINITIGTPPQLVNVNIDTGSSDLIVNAPNSSFCQSQQCLFGTFDTRNSSTATLINNEMGKPTPISYLLGAVSGDWITDTVGIGGQSILNFTLGVADTASSLAQNILGMGYPTSVLGTNSPANVSTAGAMMRAGLIQSSSFSVYLNSLKSSLGSVLFGGVDTSKFLGSLHSYPIIPISNVYARLQINVSSASVSGDQSIPSTLDSPITVMLDSGDFEINLPQDFVDAIWKAYNVTGVTISETPKTTVGSCDCALANSTSSLDIGFPGLNISVPFSSIVIPVAQELQKAFNTTVAPGTCLFNINGLDGRSDIPFLLGDSFLREVYYVVDFDSNEIALAPMNPNPGPSNILEIASGEGGLDAIVSTASGAATATSSGTSPPKSTATSAGSHVKDLPFMALSGIFCLLIIIT